MCSFAVRISSTISRIAFDVLSDTLIILSHTDSVAQRKWATQSPPSVNGENNWHKVSAVISRLYAVDFM